MIFQLSTESIFHDLMGDNIDPGCEWTYETPSCKGFPPLMLVCHYWHAVARATPDLWRSVVVESNTPKEWLALAFTRSANLTVDLTLKYLTDVPGLDIILANASRIRRLNIINQYGRSMMNALDALWETHMPALEELLIYMNGGEWDDDEFELKVDLLPALRRLWVSETFILWEWPILRNLHTLAILRARLMDDGTLDEFLETLEVLSHGPLRHLDLDRGFPYSGWTSWRRRDLRGL